MVLLFIPIQRRVDSVYYIYHLVLVSKQMKKTPSGKKNLQNRFTSKIKSQSGLFPQQKT